MYQCVIDTLFFGSLKFFYTQNNSLVVEEIMKLFPDSFILCFSLLKRNLQCLPLILYTRKTGSQSVSHAWAPICKMIKYTIKQLFASSYFMIKFNIWSESLSLKVY